MTLYEFTVVGAVPFPVDMLRHDQCWPATSTDAASIAVSIDWQSYGDDTRHVVLIGLNDPTGPRWESFGWKVDGAVRKMAGR